jgi:hypothetical protein
MDGPPFPCGLAFLYILDAGESSEPFGTERMAKTAAAEINGDWRIRAFAEDRVDHHLVHFRTLHRDGTVTVLPPSATSHLSLLKDLPEAEDLFEYDVHGGIDRLIGSTRAFQVFYERLCELFSGERKRTVEVYDCLLRAEEVVCHSLWSGSKHEAHAMRDWCHSTMSTGDTEDGL